MSERSVNFSNEILTHVLQTGIGFDVDNVLFDGAKNDLEWLDPSLPQTLYSLSRFTNIHLVTSGSANLFSMARNQGIWLPEGSFHLLEAGHLMYYRGAEIPLVSRGYARFIDTLNGYGLPNELGNISRITEGRWAGRFSFSLGTNYDNLENLHRLNSHFNALALYENVLLDNYIGSQRSCDFAWLRIKEAGISKASAYNHLPDQCKFGLYVHDGPDELKMVENLRTNNTRAINLPQAYPNYIGFVSGSSDDLTPEMRLGKSMADIVFADSSDMATYLADLLENISQFRKTLEYSEPDILPMTPAYPPPL